MLYSVFLKLRSFRLYCRQTLTLNTIAHVLQKEQDMFLTASTIGNVILTRQSKADSIGTVVQYIIPTIIPGLIISHCGDINESVSFLRQNR